MKVTLAVFCIFLSVLACANFPDVPLTSNETQPVADQEDPDVEPEETSYEEEKEEGESEASGTVPSRSGGTEQTGEEDKQDEPDTPEEAENAEDAEDAEDAQEEGTLSIVINELYYDAPGSDTDGVLFVELHGTPGMDLAGYQILFVNGGNGTVTDIIELPEGSTVYEDGFFVIADGRTGALDTTQVAVYDFIDNFDPQNGPDGVQLVNPQGDLLDTVVYGEGAVPLAENDLPLGEGSFAVDVAGGHSLSRYPAGFDTDDNSIDFVENSEPSPGGGEALEGT